MCGIAGILRLGDRPLPPNGIDDMLAAIAHRGPDGRGTYIDDDVHLGAVRLAVVDPDGGAQPAYGCGREVVCVYNGELYNHAALRARLSHHPIADACDTSLVPHLIEEHGERFVDQVRGMFATLTWSKRTHTLLLARDRLGIKPLFYAITSDFLIAASEPKAIFASGLIGRSIDPDSLDDLFSLGYPCPPRTMYRGVVELRPGHTLVVDNRIVRSPRRYWRASFGEHRRGSAGELLEIMRDATALHLHADTPIGASLSGGVDSSLIVALAGKVPTYSIRFPDDTDLDESVHARTVSAHVGGEAHEIEMQRSAAALLPQMIHHLEVPMLIPGAIAGLLISRRQRETGVRVSLSGDGADELFGGYDVFRLSKARRLLGPVAPLVLRAAMRMTKQPRGLADIVLDAPSSPPWAASWRLLDVERDALFGRPARPVAELPQGFRDLMRPDLHPFDADLALELETRLPSWILVISDRSSMAHGIETRVPFLDDEVVRYVCALPPHQKMRALREKALLRDAAACVLPRSIARRRKQPFMTPIADWFFAPDTPFEDHLAKPALEDVGLFSPEIVTALKDRLRRAPRDHVDRLRLELVLMLILGTQLLARSR